MIGYKSQNPHFITPTPSAAQIDISSSSPGAVPLVQVVARWCWVPGESIFGLSDQRMQVIVQVLLDPFVAPVVLAFVLASILRMIVTLVGQPQRLPRSPTLNLRSGILLIEFGLVI